MAAGLPGTLRDNRACLLCSMIKEFEQFVADGCENCERYLMMKNDRDKVFECTSANFDGMICAAEPKDSWVCRWQQIDRKEKGVYAISVSGSLPTHVVAELRHMGVPYKPQMRDMTTK